MPDITMCKGEGCPLKMDCYRYLAIQNEFRQSYFVTIPYDRGCNSCRHFWRVEPEETEAPTQDTSAERK